MRVLVLADYYLPTVGGVQIRAAPLMSELSGAGFEFLVVSADRRRGDSPDTVGAGVAGAHRVPVHRLPLIEALNDRDPRGVGRANHRFRALRDAFAPDLVHAYVSGPAVLMHLTGPESPTPLLVSMTIWPTHAHVSPDTIFGQAIDRSAWVTANSQALLGRLRALRPELAARSSVLVSGNPAPTVTPAALPRDAPMLLCVGRVVAEKGFDTAVRALTHLPSTVTLTIAGDGPARADLERLATNLGVADRVRLLGWVAPAEVAPLINQASLVLVPSRWQEAFASVAIQAAQLGRPVVASRVGGMAEAVLDGHTGRLVWPDDERGLAAVVAELLADPAQLDRLSVGALRHAEATYSFQRYQTDVARLYRRLRDPGE